MFTGIIESTGRVEALEAHGQDRRYLFASSDFDFSTVQLGDSIAVNGVCLTVIALRGSAFYADVSAETLRRTSLGQLQIGSAVNLERALTLQTPLGGHLVSGHVDGLAELITREQEARSERLVFRLPQALAHYVAIKGSVTLDGISLTVNEVEDDTFSVNIIPHTAAKTTLKALQVGQKVNIEVDLIARYLERLLQQDSANTSLDINRLRQLGF